MLGVAIKRCCSHIVSAMSLLQLKIRVGEAIKDCDLMSNETGEQSSPKG